jgi:hypothetical protein
MDYWIIGLLDYWIDGWQILLVLDSFHSGVALTCDYEAH